MVPTMQSNGQDALSFHAGHLSVCLSVCRSARLTASVCVSVHLSTLKTA